MNDISFQIADYLYANRIKIERGGYLIQKWSDLKQIAEEWIECHPNWTVEELCIGIRFYNFRFPEHVNLNMIKNASKWVNNS